MKGDHTRGTPKSASEVESGWGKHCGENSSERLLLSSVSAGPVASVLSQRKLSWV